MALKRQYLRPYQAQGIRAWQEGGAEATVLVLPTGAGKTSIASSVFGEHMATGGRGIMLAHRNELIDQAAQRLSQYGVKSEIVRGADSGIDWSRPMLTGTVQTLIRRLPKLELWAKGEDVLVVSDETHRVLGPTQRTVVSTIRDSAARFRLIGLTATPYRLDGQGLGREYGGIFDRLVEVVTPTFLFDHGQCSNCKTEHARGALCCGMVVRSYLMRPRLFQGRAVDTSGIRTVAGEFDHGEMEKRSASVKLVGDIAEQYKRLADGRTGVIFAVGVKHAHAIAEEFNSRFTSGPAFTGQVEICGVVTGETQSEERNKILAQIATGDLKLAVNCGVLCLDEQTEILTDRGWARHDTIKATDKVANWDNGQVFFEEPRAIHHRPRAVGEAMVVCDRVPLRVTEGHNVVWRETADGPWLKDKAGALVGKIVILPVLARDLNAHDLAHCRLQFETEHKAENVWCVTVRSGNIITRREGTVLVMGNCEGWDPESDFERALHDRSLWKWNAAKTQRVEPTYHPLSVAIDACPTQSMGKFMQGPIGRNTRNHPDKDEALYLGHADNIDRHCQPDQHHGFDLSGFVQKKDKNQGAAKTAAPEAIVICTHCFSTWPGGTVMCKDCGRDLAKGRKIETVAGDLHEVKTQIGGGAMTAGEKTVAAKEARYREWVSDARKNNLDPRGADRKFWSEYKTYPDQAMKERVYREFGLARYLFGA